MTLLLQEQQPRTELNVGDFQNIMVRVSLMLNFHVHILDVFIVGIYANILCELAISVVTPCPHL